MAVAAVALLLLTPSIGVFDEGITSAAMWTSLHQRLLPQDRWFGVVIDRQVATVPPPASAAIPQTKGPLPTPPAAAEAAKPAAQ